MESKETTSVPAKRKPMWERVKVPNSMEAKTVNHTGSAKYEEPLQGHRNLDVSGQSITARTFVRGFGTCLAQVRR